MAEVKKAASRSAKPTRGALNSTFAGRPATADAAKVAKDVRPRKPGPGVAPRNLNNTVISEQSFAVPSVSGAERDCELKLEYNKLLHSIFMECALEETREREETELDVMLAQLADRCERNIELLDNTHRRLSDISFLSERQRIEEMKRADCSELYARLDEDAAQALEAMTRRQRAFADRVDTRRVELGYTRTEGHRQLLEAMEDVLQGFESIRSQSKLSPEALEKFEESNRGLKRVQREAADLDELRREFEAKFPGLSERALIQGSGELARMMEEQLGLGETEE